MPIYVRIVKRVTLNLLWRARQLGGGMFKYKKWGALCPPSDYFR